MNEVKLNGCSPIIQETLSHLERFYQEKEIYNIFHSPAIYLLDRFDSQYVGRFFEEIQTISIDTITRFILEYPNYLTYFYKLFDESSPNRSKNSDTVQEIFGIQKNKQQVSGRIMNDQHHQLRSLVNISPEAEPTKKALDYYHENSDLLNNTSSRVLGSLYGSLALMELDYDKYEDIAKNAIESCRTEILDAVRHDNDERINMPTFQNSVAMLLASEKNLKFSISKEVRDECVENLVTVCESFCDDISENKCWDAISKTDVLNEEEVYYKRISSVAEAVHALTAAGLGYSISGFKAEWKDDLANQRHHQSKPRFVSTLPATQIEERKTSIYDTAEQMISNSNNCLRIASLRIDMLHEDIISKAELDNDVEVKILSNKNGGKGDRRKMASAVMNELVRRTKGGVRVDHLTNSRMIISDDRELLISSADLTRSHLIDGFNGGIYTKDSTTISNAIKAFDKIWGEADTKSARK